MKKIIFMFLFALPSGVFASDYSNFKDSDLKSIKYFVKDLTKIVGSSTLYSARAIGFGGFSVSYKFSYIIKPYEEDSVFYEKNSVYGINYVQVETGLPYRIDTFLRAGGNDGFNVIGGGVRYGLRNVTDELYKVNMILSLNSHMGLYKDFYIVDYGTQLSFSMKLTSSLIPFISAGIDSSKLNIKSHNDSSLIGKNVYQSIARYTAGLRLRYNWINLSMAYDIYERNDGFNASLGVRF